MKARMTPFAKLLIVAVIVGGSYGLFTFVKNSGALNKFIKTSTQQTQNDGNTNNQNGNFSENTNNTDNTNNNNMNKPLIDNAGNQNEIRVGVVTWGGYAGGEYFNEGFAPNENSRYFKNYGLKVKFIINDDAKAAREAFKRGEFDVAEVSMDALSTELESLKSFEPKVFFQSDWSRGGDCIVATQSISSINDLVGKKVAVAFGTCSHTFLMWTLNSAGINYMDLNIVKVPSTSDAALAFRQGKVDAAVVWSPDDELCIKTVTNSKVLISTKKASNLIADLFFAKKEYINSHREQLKALVEGWLIGAAEINSSEENKRKAARILAGGFGISEADTLKAINNARLATYGDNLNFFGLNSNYKGVTGEEIYTKGADAFGKLNLAPSEVPPYSEVVDTSILQAIKLDDPINGAEGTVKFESAGAQAKNSKALSTKRISITFNSGAYALDDNAKMLIKLQLADLARIFSNTRIRIEGNTDNAGGKDANIELSKKRAQSVADFLVKEYGFDTNRFIIVGNGPEKPVADNGTEEGKAKNRRTEFMLLEE